MNRRPPGKRPTLHSRRGFLKNAGIAVTGLTVTSCMDGDDGDQTDPGPRCDPQNDQRSTVAVAAADSYDRALVKEKVQRLFDALGGLDAVVGFGDKAALKINLVGGADALALPAGVDVREAVWTHPEVVRAVGELLIDQGVSPANLHIVEALWTPSSYDDFGYQQVQTDLGAQFVNLENAAPYAGFIEKSVPNGFHYQSFRLNPILEEIDVLVSLPKMKQHSSAAVTHAMKNLVGIVPLAHHELPGNKGWRSAIHFAGGQVGYHLPRAICDLNLARPMHLAVIDGIKNSLGGEGPWVETFAPTENHLLIAGTDPVATDTIASREMGDDPEAASLTNPDGTQTDNYLCLAAELGLGTNRLDHIDIVGEPSE